MAAGLSLRWAQKYANPATRQEAARKEARIIEAGNVAYLEGKRGEAKKEKISQPTPGPDQPARFNALVERYYGPTGDLETARATALLAMRRGVVLQGGTEGKFQTIAASGRGGKTLDPNAPLTETENKAAVRGETGKEGGSPAKSGAFDLTKIKVVDPDTGKAIALRRDATGDIVFEDGLGGEGRISATLLRRIAVSPNGDARKKRVIIAALVFQKLIRAGADQRVSPTTVQRRRKALIGQLKTLIVAEYGEDFRDNKDARNLFILAGRALSVAGGSEIELTRELLPDVFRKQTAGVRAFADVLSDFIPGVSQIKTLAELRELTREYDRAIEAGDNDKAETLATRILAVSTGLIPIPGVRVLSKGVKLGARQVRGLKKFRERVGKWLQGRKGKAAGGGTGGAPKPPRQLKPRNSDKDFARHPRLNTPRHRVDIDGRPLPKLESKSNFGARIRFYNPQIKKAKSKLDRSKSLLEQSKWASNQRNIIRTQARALMKDRKLAEKIRRDHPNLTWKQLYDRHKKNGLSDEQAYRRIIESSFRTNREVTSEVIKRTFGLKR